MLAENPPMPPAENSLHNACNQPEMIGENPPALPAENALHDACHK